MRLNVGDYDISQIQWASTALWLAQLMHSNTRLHSSSNIMKALAFVRTMGLNRSWFATQRLASEARQCLKNRLYLYREASVDWN